MLSGRAAAIGGYITDGDIICADCARSQVGEVGLARVDEGLDEREDLSPVIQYELDSMAGDYLYEQVRSDVEDGEVEVLAHESDEDAIDRVAQDRNAAPMVFCGGCHGELA